MERPQLLFYQSLPHSFPRNAGGRVSLARPLPTRHSPRGIVSLVFATHPKNRRLTPLFATLPKNGLPQVPCLPHLRYPPGVCVPLSPQFGTCSAAQSQASGVRRCSSLATSHHSRVTSHCHSSYCVHYRAVPQLAVNDGSVGKQSRFFRCLRKRADSGSGKGFSPRPVNGSGVPARPGSSIASRAWEHRSM